MTSGWVPWVSLLSPICTKQGAVEVSNTEQAQRIKLQEETVPPSQSSRKGRYKKKLSVFTVLHPNTRGTPLLIHIFSRAEQGDDFLLSPLHPSESGSMFQSPTWRLELCLIRELTVYFLPGRSRWHFNFLTRWYQQGQLATMRFNQVVQ